MRAASFSPIAFMVGIAGLQLGCAPELLEIREQFANLASAAGDSQDVDLYERIRERQNARIGRTSPIFCSAEFIYRWTDEGKEHFEIGEGSFFMRPPDRVALCFGKLGEINIWMAHSVDRYWLIAKDDEKPTAILVKDGARTTVEWRGKEFVLAPKELIFAAGMFILPQADVSRWSLRRGVYRDAITITLHDGDMERRVHFSEETLLPLRLEFVESFGSRLVSSISLTRYAPLNTSVVQDESPMVPTRIVIRQLVPPLELEIDVDLDTDRASDADSVFDRVFDFDAILRSMGIHEDVVQKHGFGDE